MKKIFELTNRYIVVATPLILFSLLSGVYATISVNGKNVIGMAVAVVILFLMSVTFVAGWGQMVKLAALDESPDNPNSIIKNFSFGVGGYFLPVLGLIIIAGIVTGMFLFLAYKTGMYYIGEIGINMNDFSKALSNQETLKAFLSGLTTSQLIKINAWNMLILGVMMISSFLLFLFLPALFFTCKNPFKALFISIKNIFSKNFFNTMGIYLLIFGMNFLISIFSTIFASNVIMNFVATLINFYFICCISVGVFYYYNKTFVRTHFGSSIDTYI
ncbi:MAG: hypothetical protein MJ230_01245 [bacterium]|nr:hypothetical protein [bacterium]